MPQASQLFFNHAVIIMLLMSLLSACASTPEESDPQATSLESVLYDKARAAYESGNYKTAASLFDPLAEKGHDGAQYSLGYLYYHGKGVQQDLNKAIRWFTVSAKQGNKQAITALDTIDKTLNKQPNETDSGAGQGSSARPAEVRQTGIVHDLRQHRQPATAPGAGSVTALPAQQPESVQQTAPISDTAAIRIITPETDSDDSSAAQDTRDEALSVEERKYRKWILRQPTAYFTIQLASSTSYKRTRDYVRNVALDGVYYYGETRNNITRYYIIHGSFATYSKARRKLRLLNERGYQDAWIRDFKDIRKSLQE